MDEQPWPECPDRAKLLRLDEQTACAICYAAYDAPLSLPCGHSFCAGCIRSNMEFQERTAPAKCPLCRERCDTRDLRPNKALEGLASAVQVARALLIALASSVKAPPVREQPARAAKRPRTAPPKPTPVPRDPEQVPDSSESQASSLAESSFSPSLSQSQPTAAKGCMEVQQERPASTAKRRRQADPDRPSAASAATTQQVPVEPASLKPGYLPCPNCGATLPEAAINDHLDRCLQQEGQPEAAVSAPRKAAQVVDLTASSSGARREPLAVPPKLAMMLLKDRDLKAKLALYSLPTHGKRADWEGRYAQFRVAVQTALDRGQTLSSYADIAAQLASKERSVTSAKFAGKSKLAPKAAPAGDAFSSLIKATRARSQAGSRATPPASAASEGPPDPHEGPLDLPAESAAQMQTSRGVNASSGAPNGTGHGGRGSEQPEAGAGQRSGGALPAGHGSGALPEQRQQQNGGSAQGPGVVRRKLGHNRASLGSSRQPVADVPGWQNSDEEHDG